MIILYDGSHILLHTRPSLSLFFSQCFSKKKNNTLVRDKALGQGYPCAFLHYLKLQYEANV